jgi:hypothetical protein
MATILVLKELTEHATATLAETAVTLITEGQ